MQAAKRLKFQLLDELIGKAQQEHTCYNIETGTLFSDGQLADDECISILSLYHFNVFKNVKFIVKVRCNPINALYNTTLTPTSELSIPSDSQQQALRVIQYSKTR